MTGDGDSKKGAGVSRRKWLRGLLPVAVDAAAQVAAPVMAERPVRPPGAVAEADFLALCSRCGDCAEACPYGTVFLFDEAQGALAKTPVLFLAERPCRHCDGYPCASACETGALRVPESGHPRLGGARIATERCLPYAGPECGACAGLCPGTDALSLRAGRPQIDADRCTGCGMCMAACPVTPAAIEPTL